MDLTEEQIQSRDAFLEERSLKINAFAGTGKTSTLEALAKSTDRKGLYLAFNRPVAEDARRKFPKSVKCKTIHGLAFGAFIDETVKRFTRSAEVDITASHLPVRARLRSLESSSPDGYRELESRTLACARNLWAMKTDPGDPTPLGHDGYLKLWSLGDPELRFDFIMLDEAQDTNPVALSVIRKQACQRVYVGDRNQQIYEWRGAVNAMEKIKTDTESHLTKSFRFGVAIADAASRILSRLVMFRSSSGSRTGPRCRS